MGPPSPDEESDIEEAEEEHGDEGGDSHEEEDHKNLGHEPSSTLLSVLNGFGLLGSS